MHNAIQLYFMIRFLIGIADNRHDYMAVLLLAGFPGGSDGKESTNNAGDLGSIPELGRSPGEGNGNPLQYTAWKIPWTEEPGGLQSMGSQRVGHD